MSGPERIVVEGTELAATLDGLAKGTAPKVIELASSPPAWDPIKARLFAARDRLGGLPRFVGIPACAIGTEYRELPTAGALGGARHQACTTCAVRAACSPPVAWSEELQPFRGGAPYELWAEYHARFCAAAGIAHDERLDTMVRDHLESVASTTRTLTLEPSVIVGETIAPAVRLAIFHGVLPGDPARARAATRASIEGFARMQTRVFGAPNARLLDVLRGHAPFRAPVGFEASGGEVLTKIYLELENDPGDRRRAIVADLLGTAAPTEVPWDDVMLLAVVSDGRTLRSLKTYVRRDPIKPFRDLPALDHGDPCVSRSRGRALAVIDLLAGKRPKWDLDLRRSLLSGNVVSRALGLPPRAAADLDRLLRHNEFRSDCVAVGRRGATHTLYLDLA
jgi:hypothetical protein